MIRGNRAILLAAAALALSVPLAAGAASTSLSSRRLKPDLVVRSLAWHGSAHPFQNEPSDFVVDDATKNNVAVRAPTARASRTAFSFRELNGARTALPSFSRRVPALRGGQVSRARTTKAIVFPDGSLGPYLLYACADAAKAVVERSERNNCTHSRYFVTVLARRWTGTVTGSWTADALRETWVAHVTFVFDHWDDTTLRYAYRIESANVTYTDSGTDADGCAVSGSGTFTQGSQSWDRTGRGFWLWLFPDNRSKYTSLAVLDVGAPEYPVTVSCPDGSHQQTGPYQPVWFRTEEPEPTVPAYGYSSLQGSYSSAGTTWQWNLHAA